MYEVGDRVILIVDEPDMNPELHAGRAGIVRKVEHQPDGLRIGVQWEDFNNGHTMKGLCPNDDGWFVWAWEIVPADDNEPPIDGSILDDIM